MKPLQLALLDVNGHELDADIAPGYARATLSRDSAAWRCEGNAEDDTCEAINAVEIAFPIAVGAWPKVYQMAIIDEGVMISIIDLIEPQQAGERWSLQCAPGDLRVPA